MQSIIFNNQHHDCSLILLFLSICFVKTAWGYWEERKPGVLRWDSPRPYRTKISKKRIWHAKVKITCKSYAKTFKLFRFLWFLYFVLLFLFIRWKWTMQKMEVKLSTIWNRWLLYFSMQNTTFHKHTTIKHLNNFVNLCNIRVRRYMPRRGERVLQVLQICLRSPRLRSVFLVNSKK